VTQAEPSVADTVLPEIAAEHPRLTEIRRDLHAHPELGYEETRTAALVAERLRGWGIDTHTGIGRTGVVGVLRAGRGTRSVALRADMDALPMTETNTFGHRSLFSGKMHACGHDGHTTMLLGAAQYLARRRDFDGTIVFVFQPAEEGGGGAKAMIQDGLFERFPCDAIFGIHNHPGLAQGVFGLRDGPILASSNRFDVRIVGRGTHASQPHIGIDPVVVGAQIVNALQPLISRARNPREMSVLSVTQFHAGEAYNVIPEKAVLKGTVRTFSDAELDRLEQSMRQVVGSVGAMYGAQIEFDFVRSYSPTVNDPAQTAFAASVARDLAGASAVEYPTEPLAGSEDFSYFLHEKPGSFVLLGARPPPSSPSWHGMVIPCHHPQYDFNDAILPIGATYWVRLAQQFLAQG
jgi:amidohydrolase